MSNARQGGRFSTWRLSRSVCWPSKQKVLANHFKGVTNIVSRVRYLVKRNFDKLRLVDYTIAWRPQGRALIFGHTLEENMRRIKLVVLVALAVVGLAFLGCGSPTPKRPLELTVLHTNDTLGFTEPCG